MRVMHLSLRDFRNYHSAEVELSPGRNLIIGRNGQGKTNLVEAIAYFASLKSHRVGSDNALILSGSDSAIARMRIGVGSREAVLEVEINRGRANRAQVNGGSVKPMELTRWFSSVVFAPEDLTVVRGEPSLRRRFIDESVVARNPAMSGVMSDYDRVLRQRTSLLKSARGRSALSSVEATLPVWDEQLVSLGSRIMDERRKLSFDLSEPLRSSYATLVEGDHSPVIELQESVFQNVSRETVSLVPAESGDVSRETLARAFIEALAEVRNQEFERGASLVGPHRDDVILRLHDLPVKGYASHGESWSFALALRISLAQLLRAESPAGDPVIILDDVFAELDADRRRKLIDAVSGYEQVIVTAAVEDDVPETDREDAHWHIVRVVAGEALVEARAGEISDGFSERGEVS